MSGRLAGKVALVTGAGSVGPGWGNGRASAVLFAREGARVVVADRDLSAAAETERLVVEEGGEAMVAEADVTHLDSVEAMVAAVLARFGRIDVLHNNVGGSVTGGPIEMSVDDFRGQLDLNLTSVFITCKAVLPAMVRQGAGAVINVGSIGGLRHLGHDHVGYSASKSGLVQFTRQIAVRYARDGIRCNTVIPGMIDTPLLEHRVSRQKGRADLATLREEAKTRVPLGRRGDAWDVAYAALFLASEEAKYVTGTELLVDGGLMARSA
ncbi:NAD(P)-dependent dehydrogenase (short-subunit alcohol dehydrogenase family) [Stella humosa]|uniref:NAD(P)-dependent dehydrogenase (Short-subunit alcohol dehydrogenase family) n=1 Tax=Stella humosa TaxID=94 RepID=A0A3N1MGQ6_9PROT|nr:SDR family NAD(P)-dependent oxidoreductase [Stella humosa]ROQ01947.1 NAD(P)-dependent dehydrogenase (short-subunit alcohol dehydrogenase family) [Stella humosa]BBK32336.1 oxidoreductase [Stella humosa]